MAIEGPLRELAIQDVLQLLELAKKTGILTVRSELRNDEAIIHFERGVAVYARRRRSMRMLGQQLLRAGKLTERELERALAVQRERTGQPLGSILVEQGSVGEEELSRHLRFQIEETIYDLLGWDEGYFRFEESDRISHLTPRVEVPVDSLLMEGARRIDEWARLEARVPHPECVPVLADTDVDTGPPLDLRPDEWEVLAEVDGERDLRRIAAHVGKSSFDVAKIVYGLASTGVIRVEDRPVRLPERELDGELRDLARRFQDGAYDEVERRATKLEPSYPKHAELPLMAGRALLAQGRMRAAAEAFERAVGLDPLSRNAHYHLGVAAIRIGELDRAEQALRTFMRLASEAREAERVREAVDALATLNRTLNTLTTEP